VDPVTELESLEQAIELCRSHLVEQERVVGQMSGTPDAPQAETLLAALRDLLARQLGRREELTAALARSPGDSNPSRARRGRSAGGRPGI